MLSLIRFRSGIFRKWEILRINNETARGGGEIKILNYKPLVYLKDEPLPHLMLSPLPVESFDFDVKLHSLEIEHNRTTRNKEISRVP